MGRRSTPTLQRLEPSGRLEPGASIPSVSLKNPDTVRSEDIGDLGRALAVRREAALALSMPERLARVHALCKQMSAIKGAATAR
jgi:hypothetical protein